MRPFRLACIAAEAEGVRLRGFVSRVVVRAILLMVALLFLLGAVAFAHIAAWYWLRIDHDQSYLAATGILGGADLLMAIILAFAATRSRPSRVELEALEVRRKAIVAIGGTFSLASLVIPILRMAVYLGRRRRG